MIPARYYAAWSSRVCFDYASPSVNDPNYSWWIRRLELITAVTIVKINRCGNDDSGDNYTNAEEFVIVHIFTGV